MRARVPAIALLLATLAGASWSTAAGAAGSKKTHLGVPPRQVVNVSTFQVPNDNSGGSLFYYDRESVPFSVPEGYSFVVTDVFVHVDGAPGAPGYMLVIAIEQTRSLYVRYAAVGDHHLALAGGFVIPGGITPTARNTTSSAAPCDVQLLGYFVKAPGLAHGESPFPAPAP